MIRRRSPGPWGQHPTFRGVPPRRDGEWSVPGPCLQALNLQSPQVKVVQNDEKKEVTCGSRGARMGAKVGSRRVPETSKDPAGGPRGPTEDKSENEAFGRGGQNVGFAR